MGDLGDVGDFGVVTAGRGDAGDLGEATAALGDVAACDVESAIVCQVEELWSRKIIPVEMSKKLKHRGGNATR